MSKWIKYNCRFKVNNDELEILGIKSNDSFEDEVIRIDLDEVNSYNPFDKKLVTLRMKSGISFVVEADIDEIDNYFF